MSLTRGTIQYKLISFRMDFCLVLKLYRKRDRGCILFSKNQKVVNWCIKAIGMLQVEYAIYTDKDEYRTEFLLNATNAGTNQILDMVGYEKFGIKYELCEIILCDVNKNLQQYGFTVMDGPFFSIMPFGKT